MGRRVVPRHDPAVVSHRWWANRYPDAEASFRTLARRDRRGPRGRPSKFDSRDSSCLCSRSAATTARRHESLHQGCRAAGRSRHCPASIPIAALTCRVSRIGPTHRVSIRERPGRRARSPRSPRRARGSPRRCRPCKSQRVAPPRVAQPRTAPRAPRPGSCASSRRPPTRRRCSPSNRSQREGTRTGEPIYSASSSGPLAFGTTDGRRP
jgi:hypothetical protein